MSKNAQIFRNYQINQANIKSQGFKTYSFEISGQLTEKVDL